MSGRAFFTGLLGVETAQMDADAEAFFAELPVPPPNEYKTVINTAIVAMKTAGIFSKIDLWQQFDAQFIENAGFSMINPTQTPCEMVLNGTFGVIDFEQKKGVKASNNAYFNTHFNLSTDAVQYTRDSGCYFIWCNTNSNVANKVDIGAISGGNGILAFLRDGNYAYAAVNDNSSGMQLTNTGTSEGFHSFPRISSTQFQYWFNGVLQGTYTRTSGPLPNLEVYLGAYNNGGSPAYYSPKQYRDVGFAKGDIDQVALYNIALAKKNGIEALAYIPPAAPTDEIAKIAIPSLVDSVNGYNSVLGASLPGGFTAPSIDGNNNIVFSGLQTIKLSTSINLSVLTTHSHFISFYVSAPETTQNIIQFGLSYVLGQRIAVFDRNSNRWAVAGGVYVDETASMEPKWGRALPRMVSGNYTVGISWTANVVTVFCNGIISYYSTNPGTGPTGTSGWIGAYPGTTNNNYTLPSYIKLLGGSNIHIFGRSLSANEMLNLGENIMFDLNMSHLVGEGDSIMNGFTVPTNAQTWFNILSADLIANTSHKWAPLNIGIGSRTLQTAAANCNTNNVNVPYNWTSSVNVDVIRPTKKVGVKRFYCLYMGINDPAVGRSLAQMQADLTTLINFRKSQGYTCIVGSICGDVGASAPLEAIRNSFNSGLAAMASSLGFYVADVIGQSGLAAQPTGADSNFSDGLHLTPVGNAKLATAYYNAIIPLL